MSRAHVRFYKDLYTVFKGNSVCSFFAFFPNLNYDSKIITLNIDSDDVNSDVMISLVHFRIWRIYGVADKLSRKRSVNVKNDEVGPILCEGVFGIVFLPDNVNICGFGGIASYKEVIPLYAGVLAQSTRTTVYTWK